MLRGELLLVYYFPASLPGCTRIPDGWRAGIKATRRGRVTNRGIKAMPSPGLLLGNAPTLPPRASSALLSSFRGQSPLAIPVP